MRSTPETSNQHTKVIKLILAVCTCKHQAGEACDFSHLFNTEMIISSCSYFIKNPWNQFMASCKDLIYLLNTQEFLRLLQFKGLRFQFSLKPLQGFQDLNGLDGGTL